MYTVKNKSRTVDRNGTPKKKNKSNRKWKIHVFWDVTLSQIVNTFMFKTAVMLGLLYSESFKISIYLPAYVK
jgi:hypothetical protein